LQAIKERERERKKTKNKKQRLNGKETWVKVNENWGEER
jgi:hypothetical protein